MSWWYLAIPIAVGLLSLLIWWLLHFGKIVHHARAVESFRLHRELLEAEFLQAANSTGKPRGLIWKSSQFSGDFYLAREKRSLKLMLLIPIAVQFSPIPGSDMEQISAATEPRTALAVFRFERGRWVTDGKALFNVSPDDAIRLFGREYELVAFE